MLAECCMEHEGLGYPVIEVGLGEKCMFACWLGARSSTGVVHTADVHLTSHSDSYSCIKGRRFAIDSMLWNLMFTLIKKIYIY